MRRSVACLFVGGPIDGRLVEVKEGDPIYEVAVLDDPRPLSWPDLPVASVTMHMETYRRVPVYDEYGNVRSLYRHESLTDEEAVPLARAHELKRRSEAPR